MASRTRPRVVLLRGHYVNLWDLRSWELLEDEFDVSVLVPANNVHDVSALRLRQVPVRTYRGVRGRRQRRAVLAETDRFLAATERARDALLLEGADPERIVVSAGRGLPRAARARGGGCGQHGNIPVTGIAAQAHRIPAACGRG